MSWSSPDRRPCPVTASRKTATWPRRSRMSLDNLEAVLAGAGMDLSNVIRLNIYTTDVDALFEQYGVLVGRLAGAGVAPPGTLLGVSRLAFPQLVVELEATAAA